MIARRCEMKEQRLSKRLVLAVMLLGALICTPTFAAGNKTTLTDVRLWAEPEKTRVVLDFKNRVKHTMFMLENPYRVVIDVEDGARVKKLRKQLQGKGLVQSVRNAVRGKDALRIVLDLHEKVTPRSFVLPPMNAYGHRLVVDLFGGKVHLPEKAQSTSQLEAKSIVIAIDAGHGGEDPGARGPSGTLEKNIALQIARRLARKVDATPGMRSYLTRDGDYYLSLRKRIEKARAVKADLFVSVHADSFRDKRVHGSSVYVLSQRGATSAHARMLAARENESDLIGGVIIADKDDLLASVLLDLSQTNAIEASTDVGARMLREMGGFKKLHKPKVQHAGFAVLKSPDIPSVLVETAFISNPREERMLRSAKDQERIASALMRGVKGYFADYRPFVNVAAGADSSIEPLRYTIKPGDTLSRIAWKHRVSLASLRDFNRLRGDFIRVGQVLHIPQGG